MATESLFRVSIVVESLPATDHPPAASEGLNIVARTEGTLFVKKEQALAYLGQIRDAEMVFCDPEAA